MSHSLPSRTWQVAPNKRSYVISILARDGGTTLPTAHVILSSLKFSSENCERPFFPLFSSVL